MITILNIYSPEFTPIFKADVRGHLTETSNGVPNTYTDRMIYITPTGDRLEPWQVRRLERKNSIPQDVEITQFADLNTAKMYVTWLALFVERIFRGTFHEYLSKMKQFGIDQDDD